LFGSPATTCLRGHYSGGVAEERTSVRLDVWIWSVRLAKTRSMASDACRGGHVRVNGVRVKAAYSVKPGDEVRIRREGYERIVVVTRLIAKRVGAPVAAECYIDKSPPPPPPEARSPFLVRDRGAGRPTKRERRSIEKLFGSRSIPRD
jgi:ribosome-associated heat shock protein Hsp15